ncbi:f-box cyclin-like protein [Stemphylium lycopersici]|nr:f-box cyclin-like protein [Stemphylium lycopersici]
MDRDQIRQSTITHLKKYIVKEPILETRCPLDHGKHHATCPPTASLGNLDALPTELKQHVVSFLDIKSLLTIRRVSKPAMSLVNSVLEYQKVVTNAPMTLRMAIAIGTHDKYTIYDLFNALCEQKCADCGALAHYICLFTCRRVCLNQNGACSGKLAPWKLTSDADGDWVFPGHCDGGPSIAVQVDSKTPVFTPVPGHYALVRPAPNGAAMCTVLRVYPGDVWVDMECVPDGKRIVAENMSEEERAVNRVLGKSISVVVAPWLSRTSMDSMYGSLCKFCKEQNDKATNKPLRRVPRWQDVMHLRVCEIWTDKGLVQHMCEAHGQGQGGGDDHMQN